MLWYQVLANRAHSVIQRVTMKEIMLFDKLGISEIVKPVYE
jgi:hypothetical protein